ncbi:hypothetical protein TSMEX_001944 [Taenia solium]|eukprot:TsM_000712200 transcript=TsM_000712200 gene=TsM_000712200
MEPEEGKVGGKSCFLALLDAMLFVVARASDRLRRKATITMGSTKWMHVSSSKRARLARSVH